MLGTLTSIFILVWAYASQRKGRRDGMPLPPQCRMSEVKNGEINNRFMRKESDVSAQSETKIKMRQR